ncbi:MAG TPA: CRISPR-associated endonuclease Cas3'', partial [Verrucomicrobiae bacterium]|nr:CRISPR-associated endonuclease Cas3'' [Verrucomicrobiae bacterium]
MTFYAHTAVLTDGSRDPDPAHWQPLAEHLGNVAALAKQFAAPLDLAAEAELAGLLHDVGKYRPEFQQMLRGERGSSAETQHSIFGAAWAFDRVRQENKLAGTAFAVAGHHAGLHDCGDLQQLVGSPALRPSETACDLLRLLAGELGPLPAVASPPPWVTDALSTDLYTRLLFSCLVDADRLDTACWPATPPPDKPLEADRLLEAVQAERQRKSEANPDSPLAALRNRIFDACLERAALPQGFFSLTVPTGGGKTLSSMAFALAHARAHGLRRVIVVIPYLSIIEQNAAEYRRILGHDVVLENHSGVCPRPDQSEEEKSRLELVAENWDAPVIVTTSVQFLESLFAAAPARCRKLHRIPRSVVIFDEVQTLPTHLLAPCFSAFRELQKNYGVSFVFCSATQPAFRRGGSLPRDFFEAHELREITPDPPALFRELWRVDYHLPAADETLGWPALAERLAAQPQVLCVVNLTRHAKELWEALRRQRPDGPPPIHLSAAMCPRHRLALIRLIRRRLRKGLPCRVISTQLVEAGVDVDFPVVWRALGPLDSIVQVAGRCNREGKLKDVSGQPIRGQVHVFRPADHKLPQGVYQAAADQAAIILASLGQGPQATKRLATDPQLFADYFQNLYQVVNTDYARRGETTIQEDREQLRFRQVASKAKVIPDEGRPVIISRDSHGKPYAAPLIEEIRAR